MFRRVRVWIMRADAGRGVILLPVRFDDTNARIQSLCDRARATLGEDECAGGNRCVAVAPYLEQKERPKETPAGRPNWIPKRIQKRRRRLRPK